MNKEFPDVQAVLRKGRGSKDQIVNIHWIIEKARKFQKNIYLCFIDYAKGFHYMDHDKLWKILRDRNTRPPYLPLDKLVCRSRSKLEPYMEQWTSLKLRNEYNKAVYCHPAYLAYIQSTS